MAEYDPKREEQRRKELNKILRRTHDENVEIAQSAQYLRKHDKALRNRLNRMQRRRMCLLTKQQRMESADAFGVTVNDTMTRKNNESDNALPFSLKRMPQQKTTYLHGTPHKSLGKISEATSPERASRIAPLKKD